MRKRNLYIRLYVIPIVYLTSVAALAAGNQTAPLFADDTLLPVTIDAPFTTLMEYRPDKAYLKGSFSYVASDGTEKRIGLKLRTRGNYRRDKAHCSFAPIRLNFRKGDLAETVLSGQDKLKLVTHCKTYEQGYEQLVLREYLAYRLFRELSDISYGVRLLNITYFDTETEKEITKLGFVIEEYKSVAKRNGMKRVETKYLTYDSLDHERQNLVNVFEYMIGNTEYSLVNPEPGKNCCHNSDPLSTSGDEPYISLPFDFDFSGLVHAPYAEPNPRYPIDDVRTRFYKGLCRNNELLPNTLALFADKRDDLFQVVDAAADISNASARSAKSVRNYLERFYSVIEDPEKVRKQLVEKCLEPVPR